jgi:hypothetical protein
MRRVIWSVVFGCLTVAALMVGAWTTARNFDHNGPDTPLSHVLSHLCDWGFGIGAAFIHSVGENSLSIAVGTLIAFGAPVLLYTIIYFAMFTILRHLTMRWSERRTAARPHLK